MADITIAYDQIVIPIEGKYSNDPNDHGGETVWGIARNINADWEGWAIVDNYKTLPNFPQNLQWANLQPLAINYYKNNYWDVLKLDEVADQRVATELFDSAINMGVRTASIMLQRALNVLNRNETNFNDLSVDGIVGSKTISATNTQIKKSAVNLLLTLNAMQGARYIEICEANKTQEVFFNGWIKRVSFCY